MGLVNVADNCKPCSWGWTVREFTRPGAVDNFRHRNFSICLKNVGFMAISMEGYKPRNFKKNRCSCRLKICPYFWITTLIWNGHNSYIFWANWKIPVPIIIYSSRAFTWHVAHTRGTCPRARKRVLKFVNFKVEFLWNSPGKRFQKHLISSLHTCESGYLP